MSPLFITDCMGHVAAFRAEHCAALHRPAVSTHTLLPTATGDPGSAFYFVISGRVSVVVTNPPPAGTADDVPQVKRFVNELKTGKQSS